MIAWLWRCIVSMLVWMSADAKQIALEPGRASAAVGAAKASMLTASQAPCCPACKGSGFIPAPSGRKPCLCPVSCACKQWPSPYVGKGNDSPAGN